MAKCSKAAAESVKTNPEVIRNTFQWAICCLCGLKLKHVQRKCQSGTPKQLRGQEASASSGRASKLRMVMFVHEDKRLAQVVLEVIMLPAFTLIVDKDNSRAYGFCQQSLLAHYSPAHTTHSEAQSARLSLSGLRPSSLAS